MVKFSVAPDAATSAVATNNVRRLIVRAFSPTWLVCLCLLFAFINVVQAYGQQHGSTPEPLTVIELSPELQRDLAFDDGVVADVRGPVKPSLQLRVRSMDSRGTTVEFQNLSAQRIKLELYLVQKDGRFQPTGSCPLEPGASTIEVWPENFDALGFGIVRVLEAKTEAGCN